MRKRGTTRKSISVKETTHHRLSEYLESKGGQTLSAYLEDLLVQKHPEIFGEGAPSPPEPSPEEKAKTRARQLAARERLDREKSYSSEEKPNIQDPDDFPTGVVLF